MSGEYFAIERRLSMKQPKGRYWIPGEQMSAARFRDEGSTWEVIDSRGHEMRTNQSMVDVEKGSWWRAPRGEK